MSANTPQKNNSHQPGFGAYLISAIIYGWLGVWSLGYSALIALPLLVALCLPRWSRRTALRWLILGWGIVATRIGVWPFIRLTVTGEKPGPSPAIYVFNHRSGADAFWVSAMKRPMIQAVNGWPMRLPLLGFIARQAGYLDITNVTYDEALQIVREHLEHGVSVIAFPEGHRSGAKEMLPFQSGAFRMARELGVALYPGVITGNEENPTRHFRLQCGHIHFHLLPPISPQAARALPSAYAFKQRVREQMARACVEHEVYP